MDYTFQDVKNAVENDGGFIRQYYIGINGYAILWKDDKGYSVTSHTNYPHSHGTGGAVDLETAKKDFLKAVTRLLDSEYK